MVTSSQSQTIRRDRLPFIAAILFFICVIFLLVYLLNLRLYSPLPTSVFWGSIITAILLIILQIARIPWPGHELLLVVEILMFGIVLHLIYYIPFYGFQGFDAVRSVMIMRQISEHGIVLPGTPGTGTIASWPLLMIWGTELHLITGITISSVIKWLPPIFTSSLLILLLYILIKKVFKSVKVALLTILLLITLQYFTWEGAVFKSEFFAIAIMIAGLYSLSMAQGSNKTKFIGLSILCLAGVIFTHHLTSLVFPILLIVCLVTNRILNLLSRNWLPSLRKETLVVTGIFTLLAIVGTFSYWIFIDEGPLVALVRAGQAFLYGASDKQTLAELGYVVNPQVIMTLRGRITFWGYYLFHAAFAIILLRGLLSRAKGRVPEFYSFLLLLFLYGVWTLVQLYLVPITTPGVMTAERWLMLGWIWGFAPLATCVLESKRRWGKQIGIIILAAFMLFNIYMISQVNWDFQAPGRAEGQVTLREDYALAEALPFTGTGAAFKFTSVAIYDVQGYYSPYYNLGNVNLDQLEALDWVVIKKKELESYTEAAIRFMEAGRPFSYNMDFLNSLNELLTKDSSSGRDRIYDSNNLVVLK